MKIVNDKDPPKIPDHISGPARDFLQRCWERDPFRRPNCERLLAHPFIAGTSRPQAFAGDSSPSHGVRMHPAVGSHPSPIQEEAAGAGTPQSNTPDRPSASLSTMLCSVLPAFSCLSAVASDALLSVLPSSVKMQSQNLACLSAGLTPEQKWGNDAGPPLRRRALDMSGQIGPALGPSALTAAQRPGTGGNRGALAPPGRGQALPSGDHIGAAGSGPRQDQSPMRPATAQVKARSPHDEQLPVRPFTADAMPTTPPAPEATVTPEASAIDQRAVQEASADDSPDGVHQIAFMLDEQCSNRNVRPASTLSLALGMLMCALVQSSPSNQDTKPSSKDVMCLSK